MLVIRFIIIGLQFILLIAAYVLKHLASTRMGMMRHLVMLNNKWRVSFNPELVLTILLILLLVIVVWRILRLRQAQCNLRDIMPWAILGLMALLLLLYIWLTRDTGQYTNILLIPILGAVPILQLLQCTLRNKNSKRK